MRYRIFLRTALLTVGALGLATLRATAAIAQPVLASHQFTWTDPVSGGVIQVTEEVLAGCSDGHPNEVTFAYTVTNVSYDPIPGTTTGLSGWQLVFPQPVPELHNQLSPTIGGPWVQNGFSGFAPPNGAEWDADPPGVGIFPGQSGTFSFCTAPRKDLVVNTPPANPLGSGPFGWAHTWVVAQDFIFNGPNSIPGDRIVPAPVMSSWGLVVLAVSLLAVGGLRSRVVGGGLMLRRRRQAQQSS